MKFLDRVTVNVDYGPQKYPGREHRELGRENFGTVTFDPGFMVDMIFIGRAVFHKNGQITRQPDPTRIEMSVWLKLVPAVYRDTVCRGVEAIFPKWERRRLTQQTLFDFIADLREWLSYHLEPAF